MFEKIVKKIKIAVNYIPMRDLTVFLRNFIFFSKKITKSKEIEYPFTVINPLDAFPEYQNFQNYKLLKYFKNLMLVGDNWLNQTQKPVAMLWGFNNWKLGFISEYLPEYRTVFAKRKFLGILTLLAVSRFPQKPSVFIVWSYTESAWIRLASRFFKIPIWRMEDGFIRSFGAGSLHTTPRSIALDKTGMYFNAQQPSDLENILNHYDFKKDKSVTETAKNAIEIMKAAKLTKYYNLTDQDEPAVFERRDNYSILVIGQVEDDLSIRYGSKKRFYNNDVVIKARQEHPNADIYYRPHPDVYHKNRRSRSNPKHIEDICTIIDFDIPLQDILRQIDHVYTITSLVGMEALLYGKKVTVLGNPFYAGWGLTDDRQSNRRRKQQLTQEELFAGCYLLYPHYFHPVSNQKIDFIELVSYFIIEKVKFKDLFKIPSNVVDLHALKEIAHLLSVPVQLLFYITQTKNHGSGNRNEILEIAKRNFKLEDFPQITHLLIQSSNYDGLIDYCNYAIDYLEKNIEHYKNNVRLLKNFFYYMAIALKNANGRVIKKMPDFNNWIIEDNFKSPQYLDFIYHYIRCLSRNIQYDILEILVNNMCHFQYIDDSYLQRIAIIFTQRPTRSEREPYKRNKLLRQIGAFYRSILDIKYPSPYDVFLNTALYHLCIDNETGVIEAYQSHLRLFKEEEFSFANKNFKNWGLLSKRERHFFQIYVFLLKRKHYDVARQALPSFEKSDNQVEMNGLWLEYFLALGDYSKFIGKYNRLSSNEQRNQKNLMGYTKSLKSLGEFSKAKHILGSFSERHTSPEKKSAIDNQIQQIDFVIKSGQILNSVPQPKIPKGVVILSSQTCYNTLAMLIPVLVELKRKGYAVINLMQGMLANDPTGIEYIDQFSGMLPANFYFAKINQSWQIDWENKKVIAEDINFYQGFYERLSTTHRSYFVNLNAPAIYNDFMLQLRRSDTALGICKKAFEELVGRGIPVSFVMGNSHVAPFSIMRDYCRHKDHPLLNFINANIAYENYFSNLGSKFSNTMCVTDMTLYPNIRAPFLARRDQFEPWYEKNQNNETYMEQANSLINVNRNSSTDNSTELAWIEYFKEQKAKGKKIVCVFGKIPVDLNVPYDGGNAHEDMADWLNHTVQACGEAEDIILLVKPHPHELRPEIALDIIEGFIDLIHVDIKPNVKLLGHRDINVHALAPYLDLAILWNGSSGLELTAQGIPVIMCSHFGKHDYPVDLIYPENREQYADYLKKGEFQIPSLELRKKSAFLMCYMGTDEITIINQYSIRQVTNDRIGVPRWQEDKIKHFLDHGDPKMELAASRIVEKFER